MIVAFHGFMGSGADFNPLADRLGVEFEAPDLIGHGTNHSRNPIDYNSNVQVDYWIQRIPKGSILLGYSMGGRLALQLATRYPTHFSGLIVIGGTPGLRERDERTKRVQWDASQAHRLLQDGIVRFVEYWQELPIISTQANISNDIRGPMIDRRVQQDPAMLALSMQHFGTGSMPSCWEGLECLTMPTLLMVGAQDSKYQQIANEMMRSLPSAHLSIVPNAGHCAHLENVDWSVHEIQSFIAGIGAQ